MDGSSLSRFAPARRVWGRRLPIVLAGLLVALAGIFVPAGPASAAYPRTSTSFIYCLGEEGTKGYLRARNRCPSGESLVGAARVNLEWRSRSVVVLPGSYVQNFQGASVELRLKSYVKGANGLSGPVSQAVRSADGKGTKLSFSGLTFDGSRYVGGIRQMWFFFTWRTGGRYLLLATDPAYVVTRP